MDMSSIWQSLLLGSGKPNVLCTTETQLPRFIANVVQKICTHVFLEKQKMESLSIFSLKNTNQIRNKRQHKIHPKMEKTNTKTNRHPTVVRYRLLCFFCFLCCPPFFLRIVYIFAIVERNVSFLQQIIEQSYTQCCFSGVGSTHHPFSLRSTNFCCGPKHPWWHHRWEMISTQTGSPGWPKYRRFLEPNCIVVV